MANRAYPGLFITIAFRLCGFPIIFGPISNSVVPGFVQHDRRNTRANGRGDAAQYKPQ